MYFLVLRRLKLCWWHCFQVAIIRYKLSSKSAKNINPSHLGISLGALVAVTLMAGTFVSYVLTHALLDVPYALLVETCLNYETGSRSISPIKVLPLQIPNLFNLFSLLVDLLLIKFLRKTIHPQTYERRVDSISSYVAATGRDFYYFKVYLNNTGNIFDLTPGPSRK